MKIRLWTKWSVLIGLLLITGGLGFSHKHLFTDRFRLRFLNVGQGDATLIQTPSNHTILVDGGRDQRTLQQLMEKSGYFSRTIDLLVITHPDSDHIGGLSEVFSRYKVRAVLMTGIRRHESEIYTRLMKRIQAEETRVIPARAGETIKMGKLSMKVLHPRQSKWGSTVEDPNIHSVVLRGTYKDFSFLLPGDITAVEERKLVRSDLKLKADVLKAAHHGSASSTSQAFLEAVDPNRVVISAGQNNRYGHPAKEVLDRIRNKNIKIHGTYTGDTVDIIE